MHTLYLHRMLGVRETQLLGPHHDAVKITMKLTAECSLMHVPIKMTILAISHACILSCC